MITFNLMTLGAIIFWAAYIFASVFIGTFLLRMFATKTFEWITNSHPLEYYLDHGDDNVPYYLLVIVFYVLWPIGLIGALLAFSFKMFGSLLLKAIKTGAIFADKNMPEIKRKNVDGEQK